MIHITRALARQIRSVLRKSTPLGSARADRPALALLAGPDGLHVRWHHDEVAVELHLPGSRATERIRLPSEALDDFEGRQDNVVTLTTKNADLVQSLWETDGVAQCRDYPAVSPDKSPPFPQEPNRFASQEWSCRDSRRIYVWVPLNPQTAIPPTSKAIRIQSTVSSERILPVPSTQIPPRRNNIMPLPPNNGHASHTAPESPARGERSVAITDLIAEAEELRTVLLDAATRLTRLLSGLKQHRRDSRAMQAAMQSLKQIKLGF